MNDEHARISAKRARLWRSGAILAGLAVALGAFGAHGLQSLDLPPGRLEIWRTAVRYQGAHGLALLACALLPRPPAAVLPCFLGGVLLFSGSLYLLVLSGATWLGAITPLGGLGMLAGWVILIARAPSSFDPTQL